MCFDLGLHCHVAAHSGAKFQLNTGVTVTVLATVEQPLQLSMHVSRVLHVSFCDTLLSGIRARKAHRGTAPPKYNIRVKEELDD